MKTMNNQIVPLNYGACSIIIKEMFSRLCDQQLKVFSQHVVEPFQKRKMRVIFRGGFSCRDFAGEDNE